MKLYLNILLLAMFTIICSLAGASQKYTGKWKRTYFVQKVIIESWGDNCGPKPKSYSSSKTQIMDIVSVGNHLVFSKGGLRTDRCISPNPRLSTVAQSYSANRWIRTCKTAKNDPKTEIGKYAFEGKNQNKIVVTDNTKFDWTLKGDHCIAKMRGKRIYERISNNSKSSEPVKPEPAKPEPVKPEPAKPEPVKPEPVKPEPVKPECINHGLSKRLSIHPKQIKIGPSEKVCFKVFGVDEKGCRFHINANWSAVQNDHVITGLIQKNGCFISGATAAESEGIYLIIAKTIGKQISAQVDVAFPDIGDLVRARLDLTNEFHETDSAASTNKSGSQSLVDQPPLVNIVSVETNTESESPRTITVSLIIAVIGSIFLLLAIVIILKKRKKNKANFNDNEIGDFKNQIKSNSNLQHSDKLLCPKCGTLYTEGSIFCPHDATELVSVNHSEKVENSAKEGEPKGMICPVCHRGYNRDAKFCPHDSSKLVRFSKWRQIN